MKIKSIFSKSTLKSNLNKLKFKAFVKSHKKSIAIALIVSIIAIPVLSLFLPGIFEYYYYEPEGEDGGDIDSLLWKFGKGLPGSGATMQPQKVSFTQGGEEFIVVGTDGGLAVITLDGMIHISYMTFGDVIKFTLINDISGDNQKDIVLVVYDRQHANVIAIASDTGRELWKYDPRVVGYDSENYAEQEFITYTWDVEEIDDIDDDGHNDVVISSWYRIIALEGDEGDEIWINDDACTNDIWNIEVLNDKIIAGSEAGELVAVDIDDGELDWISEVKPTTTVLLRSMATVVEKEISSSINDIIITGEDILISADNGFLYAISGDDGTENDNYELYEIPEYEDYVGSTQDALTSPYSSQRRLFQRAGMKLFETIDLNSDGKEEYMAIAYHLEYSENRFHELDEIEFEGLLFNCDGDKINEISSGEFDYDDTLYTASYPEFINVNSEIRGYIFRNNFEGSSGEFQNYQGIYHNKYFTSGFDPTKSTRVVRTGDEWEDEADDDETVGKYLLNVGDVNNDGVDDLFAISDNGKYLLIDTKNSQTIWSRTKSAGGTEITQIEDLDKDGANDYLFKKISDFSPTWKEYAGNDFQVSNWDQYQIEQKDPAEKQDIIIEFLAISALSGNVIWELSLPNPDYYEGLREVINIGDINEDTIDDYAAWIIPTDYPSDISRHIKDLSGTSTLSITSSNDANNNYVEDAINRVLLAKYTKFLAISGSNGTIFWNRPLIDFPYKYYREFGYTNTFIAPENLYSSASSIYHRAYNEIDSTWHDSSDIDYILWNNAWNSSSLTHAMNVECEVGATSDSFFDLFGNDGNNHTIMSYNSSADVLIGDPSTFSSEEMKKQDGVPWTVSSEASGGINKIRIDISFNQSLDIDSDSEYLIVDYMGNLTKQVSKISISIYNISSSNWDLISPDTINSTTTKTLNKHLDDVNNYIDSSNNNLVKLRIEASHTESFSLLIDELVINYLYELGNYSVKSEFQNNLWQTLINFTIPLEFGTDYHILSQIERISAFKLQSYAMVNITDDFTWFNFTYEIYNPIKEQWDTINVNPNDRVIMQNNSWHAGFKNSTQNGYRNTYNDFNLTDELRYDHLYLIERGTYNPGNYFGVDEGIEFDYENASFLYTDYVDSNNNFRFRINITNGHQPFELTLDTFGIGVFYWGLYGNEYDPYYVYNFESGWDTSLNNILNLKIQDFKVINGTDDNYFDVLAIIGFETKWDSPQWSSRLVLFDVKNQSISTQWGYNCRDDIPFNIVRITYLNNSHNGWILSGSYNDGNTYFSHKFIDDAKWNNTITNYDNYTAPSIIYGSNSIDITDQYGSFYEILGKTHYNYIGDLGLILGVYNSYNNQHQKIKIIHPNSHSTISVINPNNIDDLGGYDWWTSRNDFSSLGAGYKIRFSYADFNGDGYFEHVASANRGQNIMIFNGYSGSGSQEGDAIVDIDLQEVTDGEIIDSWEQDSTEIQRSFSLPFASAGDLNDDNIADGLFGVQLVKEEWGDSLYSKGAAILSVDIRSSSGTSIEFVDLNDDGDDNNDNGDDDNDDDERGLDNKAWELVVYENLYDWSEDYYEYFDYMENVGDFDGDGHSEILCGHSSYERGDNGYSTGFISELLDIYNQKLFYRFNLESIDGMYLLNDFTGDGKKEFILVSGEALYCINSEFQVEFSNIEDGDKMKTNNFIIEWDTDADYNYFELVIDGKSHGHTLFKGSTVSLGPGEKTIQIFMYDKSGIVIAVDEITITIPADFTMWILTIIIGALTALFVVTYKRIKKKREDIVLVDKDKKLEDLKI